MELHTADLAFILSPGKSSKILKITAFRIFLVFHKFISIKCKWWIFKTYPVTPAEDFFALNNSVD